MYPNVLRIEFCIALKFETNSIEASRLVLAAARSKSWLVGLGEAANDEGDTTPLLAVTSSNNKSWSDEAIEFLISTIPFDNNDDDDDESLSLLLLLPLLLLLLLPLVIRPGLSTDSLDDFVDFRAVVVVVLRLLLLLPRLVLEDDEMSI